MHLLDFIEDLSICKGIWKTINFWHFITILTEAQKFLAFSVFRVPELFACGVDRVVQEISPTATVFIAVNLVSKYNPVHVLRLHLHTVTSLALVKMRQLVHMRVQI